VIKRQHFVQASFEHISAALRGLADMARSAVGKLPPLWVRTLIAAYERIPAQLKKEADEIYIIQVGFEPGVRYGLGILGSLPEYRLHKSGLVRLRSHTFGE
jgi:hypothetical protein